jgi:hypothetical protein
MIFGYFLSMPISRLDRDINLVNKLFSFLEDSSNNSSTSMKQLDSIKEGSEFQ